MFCPRCGQQQVSDSLRFCSRCGFPLEGVMEILASGGTIPARYVQPEGRQMSPRRKGVRQGAMMMLSTLLVVPIISILSVFFLPHPEVVIPIAALLCFVGGLLRMFYALLLEESTPSPESNQLQTYSAPSMGQLGPAVRGTALPAAPANPPWAWRGKPNTAEIVQPPSVTENTTRLLDKDEPKKG